MLAATKQIATLFTLSLHLHAHRLALSARVCLKQCHPMSCLLAWPQSYSSTWQYLLMITDIMALGKQSTSGCFCLCCEAECAPMYRHYALQERSLPQGHALSWTPGWQPWRL